VSLGCVRIPRDGWRKANDKLGEWVKDQEAFMDRELVIAAQAKGKKPESPVSEAAPDLRPPATISLAGRERERKERRGPEAGEGLYASDSGKTPALEERNERTAAKEHIDRQETERKKREIEKARQAESERREREREAQAREEAKVREELERKAPAVRRRQELEEARAALLHGKAIEIEALEGEEQAWVEKEKEVLVEDRAFITEHCPPKTEEEKELVHRVRGANEKEYERCQRERASVKRRKDKVEREFQMRADQYREELEKNRTWGGR
jgi:hypothetical protein